MEHYTVYSYDKTKCLWQRATEEQQNNKNCKEESVDSMREPEKQLLLELPSASALAYILRSSFLPLLSQRCLRNRQSFSCTCNLTTPFLSNLGTKALQVRE